MPIQKKIAVLRARYDAAPPNAPDPISEDACRRALLTDPGRQSVLNYWADCTDGYLDFEGSTMFPWVHIGPFTADQIGFDDNKQSRVTRMALASLAKQSTLALPGAPANFAGFDGFLVIVWPGTAVPNPAHGKDGHTPMAWMDGGATGTGSGDAVCPVATSSHTFMVHELGHVLGLRDGYGVYWNFGPVPDGIQLNPGAYGDPFDIMSANSFGAAAPGFSAAPFGDWPEPLHKGMGPAPSRAVTHHWDQDTLPPGSVLDLRKPEGRKTVTLHSAYGGKGTRLLCVRPDPEDKEGLGRLYVEYRDAFGWDQGLDVAGPDLARRAVVFHVVINTPYGGVLCAYRGRIVVPVEVDSDLDVPGTPYTVRVLEEDIAGRFVRLRLENRLQAAAGLQLEQTSRERVSKVENTGFRKTPCGDLLTTGTWTLQTEHSFRPISFGLGGGGELIGRADEPLRVEWRVGNTVVPAGSGLLAKCQSDIGIVDMGYGLDPGTQTLSLTSAAGQRYRTEVKCTVTTSMGVQQTASAVFEPRGSREGLSPDGWRRLLECERRVLTDLLRIKKLDFPKPWNRWDLPEERQKMLEAVKQLGPAHSQQLKALERLDALRRNIR